MWREKPILYSIACRSAKKFLIVNFPSNFLHLRREHLWYERDRVASDCCNNYVRNCALLLVLIYSVRQRKGWNTEKVECFILCIEMLISLLYSTFCFAFSCFVIDICLASDQQQQNYLWDATRKYISNTEYTQFIFCGRNLCISELNIYSLIVWNEFQKRFHLHLCILLYSMVFYGWRFWRVGE
jgi:hypothetical protein